MNTRTVLLRNGSSRLRDVLANRLSLEVSSDVLHEMTIRMFGLEWAGHEVACRDVVTPSTSFLLLRINPLKPNIV